MAKKLLTRGKFDKMQQLSNKGGVIAALAIDQRGSMKKMMAAADEKAGKEYSLDQIYEFKELVSSELTKYASSILIDEELGFKGMKSKDPSSGLILSYEKTGYDADTVGRFPELLKDESLTRLKAKALTQPKSWFTTIHRTRTRLTTSRRPSLNAWLMKLRVLTYRSSWNWSPTPTPFLMQRAVNTPWQSHV